MGMGVIMAGQAHSVLRDARDADDARHEGGELLPLVPRILPLLRYDLRGANVHEGARHDGQHGRVDDGGGVLVDGHPERHADGTHAGEDA